MKAVSRFESNLLRILRGLLSGGPDEQVLPLVYRELPRPQCLSRDAVELVQDSLAKGCVRLLGHMGWERARYLAGEGAVRGRLWERCGLERRRLEFSRNTLEFLIWIAAENPAVTKRRPRIHRERLTVGDRLVQFFALEMLGGLPAAAVIELPAFASNSLLWLGWPELVAESKLEELPDFETWMRPEAAWVLEAVQRRLAGRWERIEAEKRQMTDWRRIRRLGRAQEQVLGAYLDAAERAGRPDLARFVVEAAIRLLRDGEQDMTWLGRLNLQGLRLADRSDVYRAGLTLLHALPRLRGWERTARTVGFLDEGYAGSQLWKSDWERWDGEALCERAEGIVRRFQPLGPVAGD